MKLVRDNSIIKNVSIPKIYKKIGDTSKITIFATTLGICLIAGYKKPDKEVVLSDIEYAVGCPKSSEMKSLTYEDIFLIECENMIKEHASKYYIKDEVALDVVKHNIKENKNILKTKNILNDNNKYETLDEQIDKLCENISKHNGNFDYLNENIYVDGVEDYIGEFLLTGYCPCASCCDKIDGQTASGVYATSNHTIATDSRFEFGTEFIIDGNVYTVEDRGGAIKGNRIDVFFDTHSEALNFGKKSVSVYKHTSENKKTLTMKGSN